YAAAHPIPPSWTDSRSLSTWLVGFVEFAVPALVRGGAPPAERDAETLPSVLTGSLDWLDTTWLAPRLHRLRGERPPIGPAPRDPTRRILSIRDEQLLERLTRRAREGRLLLEAPADRDEAIVQLVALISEEDTDGGAPGRTLLAVIERIAEAWCAERARPESANPRPLIGTGQASPGRRSVEPEPNAIDVVRAAGPTALALLRQLVETTADLCEAGELTSGAGLFLLTRALLDVRLGALARDAQVPFDALRGALAGHWLALEPPFDAPVSLWVGATLPDF